MPDTRNYNYSGRYIKADTTISLESSPTSTIDQIHTQRSIKTTTSKQSIQMRFSPKPPTQLDKETQTY